MESNVIKFDEAHKQLVSIVKSQFGIAEEKSILPFLKEPKYKRYYDRILYCQKVRNLLAHENKIFGEKSPIIPSDEMINFIIETIELFKNRPKCREISIPAFKVETAELEDYIYPVMELMREHDYSNIPILNNGRVIGIFSENSIFKYLMEDGIIEIDRDKTFDDLKQYIMMDKISPGMYCYLPNEYFVDDVRVLLDNQYKNGNRIDIIFLTHSGKPSEKLLGIITPWDILVDV